MNKQAPCLAVFVALFVAGNAQATFHLWDIQEVYSNSDGSVQFIELFTTFDTQQFTSGHIITTNARMFTFPSNTPAPTGGHHLLLATAGLQLKPGGAAPNFIIPSNFFSPLGDTINFVGADMETFASLPTNGSDALHFPGASIGPNSPRNYAGSGGMLNLPFLTGDLDIDGDVDFDDIDDLVLGLNSPASYEAQYGIPPQGRGDTDGDMDLDFDDIPGFVSIISGGQLQVPEPSGVVMLTSLALLIRRKWLGLWATLGSNQ